SEMALSEDRLTEAKTHLDQCLALLRSESTHTTVEAKFTLAAIQMRLNQNQEALRTSSDARDRANNLTDQRLSYETMLVHSEALLGNESPEKARTAALDVQARLATNKQW